MPQDYIVGIEGKVLVKAEDDADPAVAIPAGTWSATVTANNLDMSNMNGQGWHESGMGLKKVTGSVNIKPKKGLSYADLGLYVGEYVDLTLKEDATKTPYQGTASVDNIATTDDINGAPQITITFTSHGPWTGPTIKPVV